MSNFTHWNYPTSITVGEGCANSLDKECHQIGIKSALIVVDSGIVSLPSTQAIVSRCQESHIRCSVFSEFAGNPTGEDVARGVSQFQKEQFDGVIALGGGSSLDVAKAIALMAGQQHSLWAFEDIGDNWTKADSDGVAPVIAIPTTAGTGSEVGRASVITDTQERVKRIIFHPKMLPEKVLLDPLLTLGLPANLTAATGMDALSHNLEAYCSSSYHPMAEGIAVQAIQLIKENLPLAYSDGNNIEARTHMLVASMMGATAFQKGLGAMHALAHSLGALFNKHHGLLNAILMPYVLVANREAIDSKMTNLARMLGLNEHSFDSLLQWVLEIRRTLNIPHTLSDIDLNGNQADLIGTMSVIDPSASGNPILFNAKQYSEIYINALEGKL
ncbi:iron-containing alcohol dehydrogenase [Vibrio sp. S4M6]|uniref:iron-containing alcohol dehydrogenase n=1 Tax=Vibrio sinus TaxID=2946865 RepID=UPI00202A90A9|nr:iron-containing alcohol dehydrogenase [Vibrio sinus]MCL9783320.1 iron-containing alcohol dehydrogenase [Vibrio sinus]